jgi:hypothetical protein
VADGASNRSVRVMSGSNAPTGLGIGCIGLIVITSSSCSASTKLAAETNERQLRAFAGRRIGARLARRLCKACKHFAAKVRRYRLGFVQPSRLSVMYPQPCRGLGGGHHEIGT